MGTTRTAAPGAGRRPGPRARPTGSPGLPLQAARTKFAPAPQAAISTRCRLSRARPPSSAVQARGQERVLALRRLKWGLP